MLVQWDSDLLEFLMQVSVTEEFTLPLAEMITGNCRAQEFLERAAETGNFISSKDASIVCVRFLSERSADMRTRPMRRRSGEYMKAQSLLEKLRYHTERNQGML